MIAEQVSHYKILGRLGAGAMGEVFKAEDTRLGRQVALKFLRPELLGDAKARQRMEFEARAAAILNHPHITTLYEFDGEQGFLSFEFVEGETLEDRLEQPMDPLLAVQTCLAICRGLAHAHGRNVVHRDLKPANVLLGKDGSVKLSDFGLAKVRDALAQATQEIAQGTPAYMAPERISGLGSDHRGDLFALGVLVYRAMVGRLPWPGESLMEVLFAVLQHEPEPLSLVAPDAPPSLDELVTRLMDKEPETRLGSASLAESYLLEAEAWLLLPPEMRPAVATPAPPAPKPAKGSQASTTPAPRAVPPREGERSELPFVGRDEALLKMDELLTEMETGIGRPVLIRGTAGAGKSRFVDEVARRSRKKRVLFLKGICHQQGNRNFGALVDALEGFAHGVVDGGDRYLADLSADPEALGSLLPTLQLLLDDAPAGGQPRTREELWFLLESVLKRIAEVVPLVLIIDDLHWADEGTVALSWHLARNIAESRLMLLGMYRPEELVDPAGRTRESGEMVRGLAEGSNLEVIELPPLDEAGTALIIKAAFPDSPLAASMAPLIHRRAQGNPLFTVEILRLISTPDPTAVSADQSTDESSKALLPRNIADVVARRLARLSNEEREILDVAAVEGATFHADIIAEATGMPRLKLLSRLRDLSRTHELVEPIAEGYRFTQGLIREVLLKELPADLRQECHSVVASYLLKGYADRSDYAGQISGHLYRAGRLEEALPYLWRAAAEARRLFLYDRALIYLDRSLTAHQGSVGLTPRRTEILGARAAVLVKLGRPADARQAAELMLADATATPDHPDRPAAEEILGEAALEAGDYDAAEAHLQLAFEHYQQDESASTGVPRSQRKLATLSLRRGDFDSAVTRYTAARERLEATDDRQGVAEVRMDMGALHARRGEFEAARESLEAALAEFRSLGDRHGEARTLSFLGSLFRRRGNLDEALATCEAALPVAGRIGDRQGVANLQANIGNVHLARGDIARAEAAYEDSRTRFHGIGDHRGEAQALMALGNVNFLRGEYEAAAESYRQSLVPRETMKDRWGMANGLDNLGVTEYRLGRWEDARVHMLHAQTIREELRDRPGQIESSLNVGALYQVLGGTALARKLFKDALILAMEMGDADREVKARLMLAGLELFKGNAAAAAEQLLLSNARQVSDPALLARGQLLEAMAGAGGDPVLTGERFDQAVAAGERSKALPELAAARLARGRHLLIRDPLETAREAGEVIDRLPVGALPTLRLLAHRLLESAGAPRPGAAEILAALNLHLPPGQAPRTEADWEMLPLP
ncbi:MAG: tetratricopeptide repeat protein [Candidatus Eisenbacteria bacterium]|nr:tetratricopeptide repeat protein [Candidatus Eisenbacteria bacterium]